MKKKLWSMARLIRAGLKRLTLNKINAAQETQDYSRIDRCVCCGDAIPEGRMICWRCEHEGEQHERL